MADVAIPKTDIIAFDNSYARLPDRFFARVAPAQVPDPQLLLLNRPLAEELGLDPELLASQRGIDFLAGNRIAAGSEPLAMAYAGHQFGNWVPRLGDGRALLLGEILDRKANRRDIQLKGSGRTPFSRGGDGKAPLGPVLREVIVSEAMHALGIPSTRALAAVATGEPVYRETKLPGAILTRVASSHIRIGTFQYFYARKDVEALEILSAHVIARHYPEAADAEAPARALLEAVMRRQAKLVAQWMGVGFIHGVMNTDNMTLSGETIDYGPCAFMDAYNEGQVFSYIDVGARYAYGNQPKIAHWNLAQLAQALLPLFPGSEEAALDAAQSAIDGFSDMFRAAWLDVMGRKLGLERATEEDAVLITDFLSLMEANGSDFTLSFRRLTELAGPGARGGGQEADRISGPSPFDDWTRRWRARLERDTVAPAARQSGMRLVNPLFIPRNHLVEAALEAAGEGDLAPLESLRTALARPFDDQPGFAELARPPRPDEAVHQTFCGT